MYVTKLEDVDRYIVNAGAKACYLGELIKVGLPVPPGFVISSEAFERFVKTNRLDEGIGQLLTKLDTRDLQKLTETSSRVQNLIMSGAVPDFIRSEIKEAYDRLSIGREIQGLSGIALDMVKAGRTNELVSVRPSIVTESIFNTSFAGHANAFLNVRGMESIIENMKKAYASMFSSMGLFYRVAKKNKEIPNMGIVVQRMLSPEKAGTVYTSGPFVNDNRIYIEAAWGYGDMVVSGELKPDIYIVDKETENLVEKKIRKKLWFKTRDQLSGRTVRMSQLKEKVQAQVLDFSEIKKIVELARKVELLFGQPMDIEWCIERGRIFLMQARPITTISGDIAPEYTPNTERPLLDGMGVSPGIAKGRARILGDQKVFDLFDNDIIVVKSLGAEYIPLLRKVKGVVMEEGGLTSFNSVIARELGIPCMIAEGFPLKSGQDIVLDAVKGRIYAESAPTVENTSPQSEPFNPLPALDFHEATPGGEPIKFFDSITGTNLKVNLTFPVVNHDIVKSSDGVGLLRAEYILAENRRHPLLLARENPEGLVNLIMDKVGAIAKAFYPKPVWYRTLDARTDEFRMLEGGGEEPIEANPTLGWHGLRRSLDQPEIFRLELEAIRRLHNNGLNNIAIVLPYVTNVAEFVTAKDMIGSWVKLGIMVETPAVALGIENFCKEGVNFVSIGLKNLIQLALGIDSDNKHTSRFYTELEPVVLDIVKYVIKVCKKYGIETSINSETLSDKMIETVVELGINSISTEMDTLEEIRSLVARTERRMLLENIRKRE